MTAIHPQYIKDTAGRQLVVLPLEEFNAILEELDDVMDVKLFDEANQEDTGERILLTDYVAKRKNRHG